jgi:hypothetical protein
MFYLLVVEIPNLFYTPTPQLKYTLKTLLWSKLPLDKGAVPTGLGILLYFK